MLNWKYFNLRVHFPLGGPFVMNTKEEIKEAFRDLQLGGFGLPAVRK
ncbi:pirin-like C-terminal cupin domain-containing protein [Solibacillus kalamii]